MTNVIEGKRKPTLADLGISKSERSGRKLTLNSMDFFWLGRQDTVNVSLVRATLLNSGVSVLLGSAVRKGELSVAQREGAKAEKAFYLGVDKLVSPSHEGVKKIGKVPSGHSIYQIGGDDNNLNDPIIFVARLITGRVPLIKGEKLPTIIRVALSTPDDRKSIAASLVPQDLRKKKK